MKYLFIMEHKKNYRLRAYDDLFSKLSSGLSKDCYFYGRGIDNQTKNLFPGAKFIPFEGENKTIQQIIDENIQNKIDHMVFFKLTLWYKNIKFKTNRVQKTPHFN